MTSAFERYQGKLCTHIQIDRSFEDRHFEFAKIFKLFYIILNSLCFEEKDLDGNILRDDSFKSLRENFSSLSTTTTSKFPLNLVHQIWEDFLDLDEFHDIKKLNIKRIGSRPHWKHFMSKEERLNLLRHMRSHSNIGNTCAFSFREKENQDPPFRIEVLLFIEKALERTGVIQVFRRSNVRVDYIKFNSYDCCHYSIYTLKTWNENEPVTDEMGLLQVLDSSVATTMKKIYFNRNSQSERSNDAKLYSVRTLPFHLIQAKRTDEAFNLLSAPSLLRRRLESFSMRTAVNLHIKDSSYLYDSINALQKPAIRKKILSPFYTLKIFLEKIEEIEVPDLLYCCGLTLEGMGLKTDAHEFFGAALEIYKLRNDIYHGDAAQTLCSLGKHYICESLYEDGITCYENALKIERKCFGEYHNKTAETTELLAVSNVLMKNYEVAISWFEDLLLIKGKVQGALSFEVALVNKELGYLNYVVEKYDIALEHYESAQTISNCCKLENPAFFSGLFFWIGNTHSKLNNYEKAIDHYAMALKESSKIYGDSHKSLACIFEAKGDAHLQVGESILGISCYRRASVMQGNESTNDARILAKLASASSILKNNGDATNDRVLTKLSSVASLQCMSNEKKQTIRRNSQNDLFAMSKLHVNERQVNRRLSMI